MKKKCSSCQKSIALSKFHKNASTKDGLYNICKDCRRDLESRVRQEKKDGTYVSHCRKSRLSDEERHQRKIKASKYQKEYRKNNKEELRLKKRQYERSIRLEGIKEYGGKCSCCGEDIIEFLTLEHINGRLDESKKLTGCKAWARLKRLGWPKDNYTVLCFNCNCSKGIYGQCPHKKNQ